MSERNGDKSRFGIARKKGIVRRERSRELRKKLLAAAVAAAKPAPAAVKPAAAAVKPAPAAAKPAPVLAPSKA